MKKEEFKSNIEFYGANLDKWPENIINEGKNALLTFPELQNLIEEEKILEAQMNLRSFEEPSPDLENRIIEATKINSDKQVSSSKNIFEFINQIFSSFHLPKPAFALSLVLLIGITLGYAVNNIGNETNNENLFANEISFYDGDLYE